MRTAARLRLLAVACRDGWLEVEEAADQSHDPELIEHAVMAGLAIRHFTDRARELLDDEEMEAAAV